MPSASLAACCSATHPRRSRRGRASSRPPRTIADITAILDQEKPDPAKRAKTEAEAAAEPPAGADRAKLKDFYYKRAQARASLGPPEGCRRRCREGGRERAGLPDRRQPPRALSGIADAAQWRLQGRHRSAGEDGAKAQCHAAPQQGPGLRHQSAHDDQSLEPRRGRQGRGLRQAQRGAPVGGALVAERAAILLQLRGVDRGRQRPTVPLARTISRGRGRLYQGRGARIATRS